MTDRKPICDWCGMLNGTARKELVAAAPDAPDSAKPPLRHGHRLWLLASESSWWFFRAPDRQGLDAVLKRLHGRSSESYKARPATYGDLRKVDDVLARRLE